MRAMHQSEKSDLRTLQMENELLTHEVRHLRARLAALQREKAAREKAEGQLREERAKLRKFSAARRQERKGRKERKERTRASLEKTREDLEKTRGDLVWLLRRLDGSVLGPVVRRRKGIQLLLNRYGVRQNP
jgi:chromosome segregation ATPase